MKTLNFKIGRQNYTATVEEGKEAGTLTVTLNGQVYQVEVPQQKAAAPRPVMHTGAPAAAQAGGPVQMNSELPGTVTKVNVAAGARVKKGDVLLVIEAMKMANDIVAECDGTVQNVSVSEGQNVNQGDPLVTLMADAVAAPAGAPARKPAPAPVAPVAPVAAPKPVATGNGVTAPLPGTVTKVLVKVGDTVKMGDTVLLMEAMKMENNITAESAGTVKAICVEAGAQVQQGELLVELA